MKHPLVWLVTLAVMAGTAASVWHVTRPVPVEVTVKSVDIGLVERTVANTRAGTVKACRRARMSPSMGGQISRLPVRKGEQVRQGQLLMELWNDDLKAQKLLAEQEMAAARSRTRSACLKAEVARRNADRLLALGKKQVGTEEIRDNAAAEAAALEAVCTGARTEILVAEARVRAADAALERTRLSAPFDGIIAEINGELSEFVTPSPLGIPTPPVVDLIDPSCFYVTAPMDEVDAASIRVGMAARITLDAFGERVFQGRVHRVADYVLDQEKQARTVDVEVGFDEPGSGAVLLAGYSADVEVILESNPSGVRIPTEAVKDGGRAFVFLEGTGRIQERPVKLGLSNWDWTQVLEGLVPGDLVVVNVDRPGLEDNALASRAREKP